MKHGTNTWRQKLRVDGKDNMAITWVIKKHPEETRCAPDNVIPLKEILTCKKICIKMLKTNTNKNISLGLEQAPLLSFEYLIHMENPLGNSYTTSTPSCNCPPIITIYNQYH